MSFFRSAAARLISNLVAGSYQHRRNALACLSFALATSSAGASGQPVVSCTLMEINLGSQLNVCKLDLPLNAVAEGSYTGTDNASYTYKVTTEGTIGLPRIGLYLSSGELKSRSYALVAETQDGSDGSVEGSLYQGSSAGIGIRCSIYEPPRSGSPVPKLPCPVRE